MGRDVGSVKVPSAVAASRGVRVGATGPKWQGGRVAGRKDSGWYFGLFPAWAGDLCTPALLARAHGRGMPAVCHIYGPLLGAWVPTWYKGVHTVCMGEYGERTRCPIGLCLSSILTTVHGSGWVYDLVDLPIPAQILHFPFLQPPFCTILPLLCLISQTIPLPSNTHPPLCPPDPPAPQPVTKQGPCRRSPFLQHHPPASSTPTPASYNGQISGWLTLCRSLLTSSSQPNTTCISEEDPSLRPTDRSAILSLTSPDAMSDLRAKLAIDTKPVEYLSSPGTSRPASRSASSTTSPWRANSASPLPAHSDPTLPRHARELPMPAVRSSCNLDQANATLQLCSNKLKTHFRKLLETDPASVEALSILTEMRRFRPWLEQWEKSFSTFLATAMPTLAQPDVKRCRVLKANHLSTLILASISGVRDVDFEPFVADFKAIVGLAAAIMDTATTPDVSPKSACDKREVVLTTVMTLADPLRVVVSCCTDPMVRSRAARLLQRIS
ncbi:hypothetical protein Q7P37_008016 [Cladosporium fusiforme]